MAVTVKKGQRHHIEWIDLKNNGILVECAVMKRDGRGNIFFFEINALDTIDKQPLTRILMNRNAESFELWDLMSQITLNNGMNALEFFHQLVKVISVDGVIYSPKAGMVGSGTVDTNLPENAALRESIAEEPVAEEPVAEEVTEKAATKKKAAPKK